MGIFSLSKPRNLADSHTAVGKEKEYCRIYQEAGTSNNNNDAENPGKKPRLENQITKGEQPKAPKHLGDSNALCV
jgi:hypothetical protein